MFYRERPLMYKIATALSSVLIITPAIAQESPIGRVAHSSAGQAGQRQTRDQAEGGIEPLARIDNRIQNRVQSRIRNRIDRYYDPQANASSPFEVAGDQAREASRQIRH